MGEAKEPTPERGGAEPTATPEDKQAVDPQPEGETVESSDSSDMSPEMKRARAEALRELQKARASMTT